MVNEWYFVLPIPWNELQLLIYSRVIRSLYNLDVIESFGGRIAKQKQTFQWLIKIHHESQKYSEYEMKESVAICVDILRM